MKGRTRRAPSRQLLLPFPEPEPRTPYRRRILVDVSEVLADATDAIKARVERGKRKSDQIVTHFVVADCRRALVRQGVLA